MEIEQLIQQIFASQTNQIAATVISFLTVLAFIGMFTSSNSKIKNFTHHSPAILATVGIFFSFWGISIGLIALDLTDIQGSIPKLLDGLKVKFIASLMGIGASIVVRIAQNFAPEDIETADSDTKILHLLSDIHQLLAKQETTNFDTLFLHIKNSLIEIDENHERRSQILNKSLNTNFNTLSQAFKNFADEVARNNTDGFIKALEEAMRKFNDNTTEQFGENFKELNNAVGAMLEWQKNYKSHVEQLTDHFTNTSHSVDHIQSAFDDIQRQAEKIVNTPVELNDVLEKINLRLDELNDYLKMLTAKETSPDNRTSSEKFHDFTARDDTVNDDTKNSTQTDNTTVVTEPAGFWATLGGILVVMYVSYLIVGKVISWLFG